MRLNAFSDRRGNPFADSLGLLLGIVESLDFWGRAVEHRHGAAPVFGVAVDIGESGWQQAIGLNPDHPAIETMDSRLPAAAGLVRPWLEIAIAAVSVPGALYPLAKSGTRFAALAPAALARAL